MFGQIKTVNLVVVAYKICEFILPFCQCLWFKVEKCLQPARVAVDCCLTERG